MSKCNESLKCDGPDDHNNCTDWNGVTNIATIFINPRCNSLSQLQRKFCQDCWKAADFNQPEYFNRVTREEFIAFQVMHS